MLKHHTGEAIVSIETSGVRLYNLSFVGPSVGVRVAETCSADIVGCVFTGHRGQAVDSRGNIRVHQSVIYPVEVQPGDESYEGGARAIRALGVGIASIKDNIIMGVRGDSIYVATTAASIRRNLIQYSEDCCKPDGVTSAAIWVTKPDQGEEGEVLIEANYILDNRIWTGIGVRRTGPTSIRNNVIVSLGTVEERATAEYTDQTESLAMKIKGGTPRIESNYASDIAGRALMLTTQAEGATIIENNRFEKCDSHCVYAFGPGATYVFRNNEVLDAGRPFGRGLYDVSGGMWLAFGTFRLERNTVRNSHLVGIGILNSVANLDGNAIFGTKESTFELARGIRAVTADGLATLFETDITAVRNWIQANERGGMLLDTAGIIGLPQVNGVRAVLRENVFLDNREFGLFVQNGALADIGSEESGAPTTVRGSSVGIGATKNSRGGVRLFGPDAGQKVSVRGDEVEAVRLEVQDFASGVRLMAERVDERRR